MVDFYFNFNTQTKLKKKKKKKTLYLSIPTHTHTHKKAFINLESVVYFSLFIIFWRKKEKKKRKFLYFLVRKTMENPKLEQMGSGNNNHNRNWICESEEKGGQRISVAHQIINGLDYQKGDSFIVDIEPHLHLSDNNKDLNPNSRVTLQRSLSRKGSTQKKSNNNDTTNNLMATSPRDASTPEKSMVVTVGSTDHAVAAQLHNAITIVAGNSGGGGGATPSESKLAGRRFSFKRSSSPASWSTVTDPRRILLFFATLSSMGTILLIYFTLSISKLNGEDSELN